MMKKLFLYFLISAVLLSTIGCAQNGQKTSSQQLPKYRILPSSKSNEGEVSSKVRLFIGAINSESGVVIHSKPDKSMTHHILSQEGDTVYSTSPTRRRYKDAVTEEMTTDWIFNLDQREVLNQMNRVSSAAIVVETSRKSPYKAINTSDFIVAKETIQDYLRKCDIPQKLLPIKLHYRVIRVGTVSNTTRLLIMAWEEPDGQETKRLISIANFNGQTLQPIKSFPINEGGAGDQFFELWGLADLNSDGLADVFLFNYGDFGGKELFIEESSSWSRQMDDWGPPC